MESRPAAAVTGGPQSVCGAQLAVGGGAPEQEVEQLPAGLGRQRATLGGMMGAQSRSGAK